MLRWILGTKAKSRLALLLVFTPSDASQPCLQPLLLCSEAQHDTMVTVLLHIDLKLGNDDTAGQTPSDYDYV